MKQKVTKIEMIKIIIIIIITKEEKRKKVLDGNDIKICK